MASERDRDRFLEIVGQGIESARQLVESFAAAPPADAARLFAFTAAWCGKLAGWDSERLVEMFACAIELAEHRGMVEAMRDGITAPATAQKEQDNGNS